MKKKIQAERKARAPASVEHPLQALLLEESGVLPMLEWLYIERFPTRPAARESGEFSRQSLLRILREMEHDTEDAVPC